MKFLGFFTFLLFSISINAQEDFLAKQYFADGDFEKAVVFYEKLAKQNPRRTDYLQGLIACYQQLERYTDAEAYLLDQLNQRNPHPTLLIEMGYNYSLQDMPREGQRIL
ncbi:tetratricopeptide repeat protein [Maribacter litopenaei]|uniref:tetratricopeptide repeat protein n=1 Tax=Maribacter litopenaei TaxID=2976127 RepID=UPI00308436AD